MAELLALKYRPKLFSELVGQQKAVKLLSRSVQLKRFFPCYLISGPFGAGKTSIVRIFSKAVLCEDSRQGEPCGQCSSCRDFDSSSNPNYTELDAASHGGVDDVRRLKDEALYRPFGGKPRRVIHLDEAGSITRSGNNAFLKLLEEGSESCIFVLTTTDPDNIFETVKSRSFEIELNKITTADIHARLLFVVQEEAIPAEDKALRLIASYSQGHLRDALMLLDQMRTIGPVTEQLAREMLKVDTKVEFLRLIHALATDFNKVLELLDGLESRIMPTEVWRGLLEALLDCYLLYRGVSPELDPIELQWSKQVVDQGATFLTSTMQLMNTLTTPRSQVETRFNLCLLAEKVGRRSPMATVASSHLQELARRAPVRSHG